MAKESISRGNTLKLKWGLTIRMKLLLLALIIGLSFLGTGYLLYSSFQDIFVAVQEVDNASRKGRLISEMKDELGYGGFIHFFQRAILDEDLEYITAAEAHFEGFSSRTAEYMNLPAISDEETGNLMIIDRIIEKYSRILKEMKTLLADGKPLGDMEKYGSIDDQRAFTAFKWFESYLAKVDREANQLVKNTLVRIRRIILVVFGSVLLITVTLTLVIGTPIARKLKELLQVTNDLAAGNLIKRMAVKVDDEIGRLVLNFNKVIDNLQDTAKSVNSSSVHNQELSRDLSENVEQTISVITEINNGINSISDDTEHLTHNIVASKAALERILDNNKSLADQINNQASSVEQTSASVEEMNASIKSMAKITEEKKKAVDKLVSVTMTGGEKVNTTTEVISQISRSIDDMLNLITVINKVASQTDLLSMNAAIEAAQAGDAGKGFAVVADEIGKLAESTSENALSISQTLKSVVDKIKEALTAGKESGQAFAEITAEVKEVADAFSEISLSTDELANGSREILNATNDLLKSTEEIRSDSAQMQQGSEEIRNFITEIQGISANNLIGVKSINTKSNDIYDSIDKISRLIIQNGDNAEEMHRAMDKFKINGESFFDDKIDTSVCINARIRHKLWLIRVEQFLHDSHAISEEEIVSAEECSLGRWLYSSGLKRFADIDEITSLERVHKEMHEKCQELVSLSGAGEKAQAKAVLQEVKSFSQAITGYLDTIEEKIALRYSAQELEAL